MKGTRRWGLLALLAGVSGCGTLLGLDDFTDQPGGSATAGAGGAGSTTSTAASGGGGASATTGQGGAGGATFCEPGATMPCYTGPAGTEGVGLCAAGEATCLPDGSAYGACAGDTLPAPQDDCATQEDENCDGYQCGEAVWSQMFHGTSLESPAGVAVDTTGNIYLFGDFRGSVDFGGGALITAGGFSDYDLYLAKFAPDGTHLWSKQFGDSAAGQYAKSIAIDANGRIVLSGGMNGSLDFGGTASPVVASGTKDGFVAVLDDQASGVWARALGASGSEEVSRVAVDESGNVFIAQTFSGNPTDWGLGSMSAPSGTGMFAAKLTAVDGATAWLVSFDNATAGALATDPSGSVYVGGSSNGVDFGFGPLVSAGTTDGYVVKLTGAGTVAFPSLFPAKGPGDAATTVGLGTDGTGNLFALVSITGMVNVFDLQTGPGHALFKANSLGLGQWAWFTPNSSPLLSVSPQGDSVLLDSLVATALDVTRVSADGATLWHHPTPSSLTAQARGVTLDPFGYVVVAGEVNGTADFGDGPLTSTDLYDAVVAKLAP